MIEVWKLFQIVLRDTNLCTIFMRFKDPHIYMYVYHDSQAHFVIN